MRIKEVFVFTVLMVIEVIILVYVNSPIFGRVVAGTCFQIIISIGLISLIIVIKKRKLWDIMILGI